MRMKLAILRHVIVCEESCKDYKNSSVFQYAPVIDFLNHYLKQVWILEDPSDANSNMYVHHDIIIPAFPLCTAWLDCPIKGGDRGNNMGDICKYLR